MEDVKIKMQWCKKLNMGKLKPFLCNAIKWHLVIETPIGGLMIIIICKDLDCIWKIQSQPILHAIDTLAPWKCQLI